MKASKGALLVLGAALAFSGCATSDELIADKDRALNEKQAENEALRKRLADQESIRLVMEKQLEQARSDAETAQRERERLEQAKSDYEQKLEELRKSGDRTVVQKAPGLEVEQYGNGLVILRLEDRVTFSPGSATLADSGQKLLGKEVAAIIADHADHRISIEGHTDDTPIKKSRWKTNLNLSIARALEVRRFLTDKTKIPAERMRVVGYGDTRPLVVGKTDAARARNRRVEIVLYKEPASAN